MMYMFCQSVGYSVLPYYCFKKTNVILIGQIDLETIKDMYLEKYDVSLKDAITSECGGDFKRLLLAICH